MTIESETKMLAFERKCNRKIMQIEGNERGNLHKDAAKRNLLQEAIKRTLKTV